jgi:hypothetical protein
MKSDKSPRLAGKPKREFGGSVELIPARPDYTEFIDAHRIWAFPISYLTHLLFQENPNLAARKHCRPTSSSWSIPTRWWFSGAGG